MNNTVFSCYKIIVSLIYSKIVHCFLPLTNLSRLISMYLLIIDDGDKQFFVMQYKQTTENVRVEI